MKLKKPLNSNYAAVVVTVDKLVQISNCNNVRAAIIMGNHVIVGNDVEVNDMGIYFPLECALSKEYMSANNLYRNKELNINKSRAGYFEENGRVRCVKFRGNKSEGLFMPLDSLEFSGYGGVEDYIGENFPYSVGTDFDEFNNITICSKYIPKGVKMSGMSGTKQAKQPNETKIVENQFRFHADTNQLYKNLHKIEANDTISITYKEHGTSGVSSKVLCKRKLSLFERVLVKLGVNIPSVQYDFLNSSRKVIKNPDINPNANHFYNVDIWSLAHNEVKDSLQDGMTLYYEIVGYTPNGAMIQKDFDYGCNKGEFKVVVYRITHTTTSGRVYEFSAKQVQDWCKENGIEAVDELYYGKAIHLLGDGATEYADWRNDFLIRIKNWYNEKDCYICSNKVPEEGCVIRIEKNEFEAYKAKSTRFYEYETYQMDKGVVDMETEN